EYDPMDTTEAAELVAKMKSIVPKYVRIQRVQRDIPSPIVDAGVKKSNLRQYAREGLKEMGETCDCIRCREVGHSDIDVDMSKVELNAIKYLASKGDEYFLEYGDNDVIIAYARLRISEKNLPTIRELKVLGEMTPINEEGDDYQHRGFGKKLVDRCESIAEEYSDKIRVTSGVGAREYYRKLNYSLNKPYMMKKLE
ncbi:MAG: GNAT family N-acetyltransferase, partial [Thermoplasmata archaeon]